jgi:hypothetical protein
VATSTPARSSAATAAVEAPAAAMPWMKVRRVAPPGGAASGDAGCVMRGTVPSRAPAQVKGS